MKIARDGVSLAIGLGAILFVAAAGPLMSETPDELLLRIDTARSVPDLRFTVDLTSYRDGKVREENTLKVQIKTTPRENMTLAWFSGPASVHGRRMLMENNTVYLLFPRTRNPIRLSPLQVLVGEASNGDVARTGFAQEFDVKSLEDATVDGETCWRFELKAKADRADGTYGSAVLWVDKSNLHPLNAEFATASGQVLKKAVYGDWKPFGDKVLPCKMDISDAQDPTRHTVLTYSGFSSHLVPTSLFSRDALTTWNPEDE